MKKTFTLLALCALTWCAKAQTAIPADEDYGKIDKEDLELTKCDFEKDANAEVLIDKGDVYYDQSLNVVMDYHKRIKIFNDNGKDAASIKIIYYSNDNYEFITGVQAETINFVDGKEVVTKLDKKLLYKQTIDKYRSALVFTMPDVKAGSIIDYKYTWNTEDVSNIPTWFFQGDLPVRYSEIITAIPEYYTFSTPTHLSQPFTKLTRTQGNGSVHDNSDNSNIAFTSDITDRVLTNVPSLDDEYGMSSKADNLETVIFNLTMVHYPFSFVHSFDTSWGKAAGYFIDSEDFGGQVKRKLANEDDIITRAAALKTDDDKIAYIFNTVKSQMKWNGEDQWYTNDGTSKAWDTKTGNSTEINLILCHLLKKAGIDAYPMAVSTRDHGKVNPAYPYMYQFNRGIVYVPVDSTKKYFLDATGKYNMYNETPSNLLNSYGLYINIEKKKYDLIFINKPEPVRRVVFINANIQPGGKMDGTAQISCFSYNRIDALERYKTDGETKFIDYLRDNDNALKISSLKMDNMDVDSLPLVQNVNFNLDMAGSDENYIYLNPNLFTTLHANPFLSENRATNIDFGYLNNLTINGIYKIPAGYKVDVLPKNISMTTPDQSIVFRRIVGQQDDGSIATRYVIMYKKSIFFKENYADFHEFFKKMYEMLNEQIVLKKS